MTLARLLLYFLTAGIAYRWYRLELGQTEAKGSLEEGLADAAMAAKDALEEAYAASAWIKSVDIGPGPTILLTVDPIAAQDEEIPTSFLGFPVDVVYEGQLVPSAALPAPELMPADPTVTTSENGEVTMVDETQPAVSGFWLDKDSYVYRAGVS